MQLICRALILSAVLSPAVLASDCSRAVVEGQLNQSWLYDVSYQGMNTQAERRLTQEGDVWHLQQAMSLLIVSLNEESRFRLNDNRLEPLSYLKEQKGLGARYTRIEVDSSTSTVSAEYKGKTNSYSAELPLSDPLAHSLQIQIDRQCDVNDMSLDYRLVGRTEVKSYTYVLEGQDRIPSPWGEVLAERWQRNSGDVQDRLWLVPSQNFALVRFEHVEKGELSSMQLMRVQ